MVQHKERVKTVESTGSNRPKTVLVQLSLAGPSGYTYLRTVAPAPSGVSTASIFLVTLREFWEADSSDMMSMRVESTVVGERDAEESDGESSAGGEILVLITILGPPELDKAAPRPLRKPRLDLEIFPCVHGRNSQAAEIMLSSSKSAPVWSVDGWSALKVVRELTELGRTVTCGGFGSPLSPLNAAAQVARPISIDRVFFIRYSRQIIYH